MGMIWQLSPPGMQEARKAGQRRADEARGLGKAFERLGRGREQAWEASLGCERHKGRSASGTVKVIRKYTPGSCLSSWLCNHCAAF